MAVETTKPPCSRYHDGKSVPPPPSAMRRGARATIAPTAGSLCCGAVRERLRDLGYAVGRFPVGARNAIVDVPGVLVGHRTIIEGERLRTGVTAILPHGGNLHAEQVLRACHVVNGYGKAAGLSQLL